MIFQVNIIHKDNDGIVSTQDYTNKVLNGFSVVEKLDDTLDSGQITLRGLDVRTPFTLFDTLQIKVDGVEVHSLRISSDTVNLISKRPKLYEHVLTLVEHTKIAELFIVQGKTFTQPTDGTIRYYLYDVLRDLIDTTPFELNSLYSTNRPIVLPTTGDLYTLLTTTPSPEFTFKDLTLRECFKQVCDYVDGIPRLFVNSNDDLELTIDFVGELKNLITSTDEFITESVSQNAQFYATQIESESLNLVSDENISESVEFYPDRETYINFRRTNDFFQADFENSVIPTPKKISRVIAMNTWANVTVENTTKSLFPFSGSREWRMTYGIVEKTKYDQLPFVRNLPSTAELEDDYKTNSIYWEYKKPNVFAGEVYTGFTGLTITEVADNWYRRNILMILKDEGIIDGVTNEYDDNYTITFDFTSGFNQNVEERIYNVEYIPIPDSTRINIERLDINDVNRFSQMLSNQQLRIVNLENFSNNLQGKINRIGNSDLELSNRTSSPTSLEVYNIGDYTDELYIITTKESIYFKDYVDFKYGLTRNFNKISSFIGVNSEIRQWEIGERNTLERNLVYKEYVEVRAVGSGIGQDNAEVLTADGIDCYLETFDTSSTKKPISVGVINPVNPVILNRSIVGLSSNGGGNSLIFNFKVDDNISVGYYKLTEDGQKIRQYSKYANDDGILERIQILGLESMNEIPSFQFFAQDVAEDYPKITEQGLETSWEDRLGTIYLNGDYYLKKDSREILGQTFQLAQVPFDNDKVVIGRALSTENRLVNEVPPTSFKLYTYDTEKYTRVDNFKVKAGFDTVQTITPTLDKANYKMTISHANLTASKSSWCLTDQDDNILIAVNQDGTLLNVITFFFNNKRFNVNYRY